MESSVPDNKLWRIAQKRAAFKRHLSSYLIVNLFLWAIWWFTSGKDGITGNELPWPVWPMLGWGLGLAFNYFNAYGTVDRQSAIQKEYEKLKAESDRLKH